MGLPPGLIATANQSMAPDHYRRGRDGRHTTVRSLLAAGVSTGTASPIWRSGFISKTSGPSGGQSSGHAPRCLRRPHRHQEAAGWFVYEGRGQSTSPTAPRASLTATGISQAPQQAQGGGWRMEAPYARSLKPRTTSESKIPPDVAPRTCSATYTLPSATPL
jgi:hypothetical protein